VWKQLHHNIARDGRRLFAILACEPLRYGLIRPEAVLGTSATSRKPWRRRASAKPANYLTQAGVKVTAFRLGDQGLHGNAHMVMPEKKQSASCRCNRRMARL